LALKNPLEQARQAAQARGLAMRCLEGRFRQGALEIADAARLVHHVKPKQNRGYADTGAHPFIADQVESQRPPVEAHVFRKDLDQQIGRIMHAPQSVGGIEKRGERPSRVGVFGYREADQFAQVSALQT
jgi:hypothetical protein